MVDDNPEPPEKKEVAVEELTSIPPSPKPPTPSQPTKEELLSACIKRLIESIPPFSFYETFRDLLPSEEEVTKLGKNNAVKDFEKVFSVDLVSLAEIQDIRDKKNKLEELEDRATEKS